MWLQVRATRGSAFQTLSLSLLPVSFPPFYITYTAYEYVWATVLKHFPIVQVFFHFLNQWRLGNLQSFGFETVDGFVNQKPSQLVDHATGQSYRIVEIHVSPRQLCHRHPVFQDWVLCCSFMKSLSQPLGGVFAFVVCSVCFLVIFMNKLWRIICKRNSLIFKKPP